QAGVHESSRLPLGALQLLLTVKLIHEGDRSHAKLLALGAIHPVERIVEAPRPKEEAGVGYRSALEALAEEGANAIIVDPGRFGVVDDLTPEDAKRLKQFEVCGGEPFRDDAGFDEGLQRCRSHLLGDSSGV